MLLLTATPEQLGTDSHFARLRLLDPNRFHDLDAFRAELQLPASGRSRAGTARRGRLSQQAHQTIHDFLGAEGEALLAAALWRYRGQQSADPRAARPSRHRPPAVPQYARRRSGLSRAPAAPYPLPCPAEYMELPLGEHAELYPEVAFQSQQEPADEQNRWWQFDPRVEWLIDTLKMLKKYKVLVICAHAGLRWIWRTRCACAPASRPRYSTKA